jgi:hypothetical protein
VSTAALQKARKNAVSKEVKYGYFEAYTKTLDILKETRSHVYKQSIKKHLIALYVSEQDTTAVGIFFTEVDAEHTKIEVSSLSTYGKERVAQRLFALLEGLPDPYAEEAETGLMGNLK